MFANKSVDYKLTLFKSCRFVIVVIMEWNVDFSKIVARQWDKEDLDLYSLTKKNLNDIRLVEEEKREWNMPSHFVRKKLKGNIGYGIFLHVDADPLVKGQIIGPYEGDVTLEPQNNEEGNGDYAFDLVNDLRLTKEEQARYDPKRRYHHNRLYSLKLDALKKGNFTRFINHSDEPNVEAHLVFIRPRYQIIYMAKKKIHPGEQLLVSYEDGEEGCYWGVLGIEPVPMTPRTFRLDSALRLV